MFPKITLVKQAIESLYDATAEVYAYEPVVLENGATDSTLHLQGTSRCRICYKSISQTQTVDTVDTQQQIIKMHYDGASLVIKPGSKIIVNWDDGRTETFCNTSLPQVYPHHAELTLELKASKP